MSDKSIEQLVKESTEAFLKLSPEERQKVMKAQRASYVRGEMSMGSDADEAAYAKALLIKDHETLARLDAEADARVALVDKVKL